MYYFKAEVTKVLVATLYNGILSSEMTITNQLYGVVNLYSTKARRIYIRWCYLPKRVFIIIYMIDDIHRFSGMVLIGQKPPVSGQSTRPKRGNLNTLSYGRRELRGGNTSRKWNPLSKLAIFIFIT